MSALPLFHTSKRTVRFIAASIFLLAAQAQDLHSQPLEDHCSKVPALLNEAAKLRGLEAPADIRCYAVSPGEYAKVAKELSSALNPEADLKKEEILFKILGFVPKDYNYASCMLEDSGSSTYGFYSPKKHAIYLRKDLIIPNWIILHELVHAIQDKKYDLNRLQEKIPSTDLDLGLAALIEGDAVFREEQYKKAHGIAPKEGEDSTDDEHAPNCPPSEPLISILLFPYEWGSFFFRSLSQSEAGDVANKAFASAPLTTHDVLHAKRFISEGAYKVPKLTLPPPPQGYEQIFEDSLGEFMLRSLFKQYGGMQAGVLASKGWRGDVVGLYERRGKNPAYQAVWVVEVDSQSSLEKAAGLLRLIGLKRFGIHISDNALHWSATLGNGLSYDVETNKLRLIVSLSAPASL